MEATNYECEIAKGILSAIVHILLNLGLKNEADTWRVANNRVFLPLDCDIIVRHYPEDEYNAEGLRYHCSDIQWHFVTPTDAIKWAVEKSLNLENKSEVAAKLFFPELFE